MVLAARVQTGAQLNESLILGGRSASGSREPAGSETFRCGGGTGVWAVLEFPERMR